MPTYGYRCTECAHEFELVQKMTDPPITECPVCGQKVKKILYPVGISFKGDGFYVNDSQKAADKRKAAPAEAGSADAKDPKPEAKTETKTEGSTASGDGAATTTPATPSTPATPAAPASDAK